MGQPVAENDIPENLRVVPAEDLPGGESTPSGHFPTFTVPARPRQFLGNETQAARMINTQVGTRQVPKESPVDRGIYELGGKATDFLTNRGFSPEGAALGGYLTNVGAQTALTFLGGNLGAKAEPASQELGVKLMQKAMKPTPLEIATGNPRKAAETMLKEGRMVTRDSVDAMTKDIVSLNSQIMDIIKKSPETVNKTRVAMYARRAYDKWVNQVNKADDINAVKAAVKEFLEDPSIAENMPALAAQKLKQGTYASLGNKAYEPGRAGITASVDAQKDLARGLKEELAIKHPAISGLNARESSLINAREFAEKGLAKSEARDKVGMGWLSNHPASYAGWIAERSPFVKSLLARYFYDYADPEMVGRVAGAAVGAHSGSAKKE